MPKLKTHKATAKRIKISGSKKYLRRKSTQDHFNARDRGKDTRNKRGYKKVHKTNISKIKKALPYS